MRVLYVDDEADIREIAELALGLSRELTVATAGSGAEAIAACAEARPDLIILDVMMPDMDGPTTLARLRDNTATSAIPVVFVTARTQSNEIQRFIKLGAAGVIPKPFDPMTLASQVMAFAAQSARA